ncbi:MAG TPA: thiamine phosphate synthase [Vicinamibacterales bacterium]|nr:thiamine phosphate synthase [Vicinamibacterales bacterium]
MTSPSPKLCEGGLYPILDVDAAVAHGWGPLDLARAWLDGGARLVQLRAKWLGSGALLDLAEQLVALTGRYGGRLIVNDRADVARMTGAAGVHVGQEDVPAAAARAIVGADALVGLSTHTAAQIDVALHQPISYLAVGPVFGTSTKETGYAPVGLDLIRYAVAQGGTIPVVGIGGIDRQRAPEVLAAGAAAVAVISDLITGDPAARVRAYLV